MVAIPWDAGNQSVQDVAAIDGSRFATGSDMFSTGLANYTKAI